MSDIIVVDALMGSGKTSWSIQYINNNINENILYITPFLNEADRIINQCSEKRDFRKPINRGTGKLASLNDLLSCQEDIAATHELFKHLDEDSHQYIQNGHYTLILDEVLNVLEPIAFKPDDLKILKESGCIYIDEDGFVIWNPDKQNYDTEFNELKQLAENRSVICINDVILLWRYPPDIFKLFDKVFVLTYFFESSILKYYFDVYDIVYTKKSICYQNGLYDLCDYFIPNKSEYVPLINIYQGTLNDNFRQKLTGLSSSWFNAQQNKPKIRQLQKNIYNYFTNIINAKSDTILWTTFKKSQTVLKGKGYSTRFLACNCRSTNDYASTYNLAYGLNVYVNPAIVQFFLEKGVVMNQDAYALAEMLQWIWRSRIRNGQKINVYIPSTRMRGLLQKWLEEDTKQSTSQKVI